MTSIKMKRTKSEQKLILICLVFLFLFANIDCFSDPWGDNLRPKLHTDYLTQYSDSAEKFLGNQTHKDYFKLLRKDGASLLIGARNVVYNLSLPYLNENPEQRITWNPSETDRELCLLKGKSEDDCQNYIRVLAKTEDGRLLLCGTNAYNPRCRFYSHNQTHTNVDKEFSGKGFCPYDPRHNSTALYTSGDLYSGTVADFSASDALIIKDQLRTEQYDFKHLNNPNFVSSLEDDDHVYFFFRESAVEYMNCGKSIYSRVARVCKNDQGGPHKFNNKWTTFLKSRLNCSIPGELPFYFDEIQSTSGFVDRDESINRGLNKNQMVVYGVFTTPDNAIAGSAICSFRLSDILSTFEEGPFKNQETVNSNWLPTSKSQIPDPRPGLCYNDTFTLPESSLNFIKRHSLMDWSVPNAGSAPVFVKTGLGERLTVIAVDSGVQSVDGNTYDVLFVGTTHGRVLKIANSVAKPDPRKPVEPVLIESVQIFPYHVPVRNLLVVHPKNEPGKLIVLSDHEVNSIPLHRCPAPGAQSCEDCVGMQDPYCAWNVQRGLCVAHSESETDVSSLIQDLPLGFHSGCPITIKKEETTEPEVEIVTSAPSTTTETTSTTTTTSTGSTSLSNASAATALSDLLVDTSSSSGCEDCFCNCSSQNTAQIFSHGETTTERRLQIPTFVPFYDEDLSNNLDEGRRRHHNKENNFQLDSQRQYGNGHNYPNYQPSHSSGDIPTYTERTFALAVIATALLALAVGFLTGFVASKRCPQIPPPLFRSVEPSDSAAGHHHKDLFSMEIVDKTLSLKNRASAAISRAGIRCSNQFGRIYDHRRPRFGFGTQQSDQEASNRTSTSSTGSPPSSPASPMTSAARRNLDHLDSGYTTPSNMTNASVATQDTSVSTPSSSPSPTSTASIPSTSDNLSDVASSRGDVLLTKSVNLLANLPQKSETVKSSRPIINATVSLPLQHDMASPYATLGGRHPNHQPHYIQSSFSNGSSTTIPRRGSPTEPLAQIRAPRPSLVTATTSNPGAEGTLQKVKRVYL